MIAAPTTLAQELSGRGLVPQATADGVPTFWTSKDRAPALLRYGNETGMVIAPPSVNANGVWYEGERKPFALAEHSLWDTLKEVGDQLGNSIRVEVTP